MRGLEGSPGALTWLPGAPCAQEFDGIFARLHTTRGLHSRFHLSGSGPYVLFLYRRYDGTIMPASGGRIESGFATGRPGVLGDPGRPCGRARRTRCGTCSPTPAGSRSPPRAAPASDPPGSRGGATQWTPGPCCPSAAQARAVAGRALEGRSGSRHHGGEPVRFTEPHGLVIAARPSTPLKRRQPRCKPRERDARGT